MAKDREKRMVNNRKRREKLEMQRARDLKSSTSAFRRDRAKKQTIEEKARVTSVKGLCTCVVLASRIQNAAYIIQQYRDERQMVHMQNFAAKLIARRMRLYCFRKHRRRVKGAIGILSTIFMTKIRLWKFSRWRKSADIIRDFLLSLEEENKKSGGCMSLVLQGKKWRAYKMNIITAQVG